MRGLIGIPVPSATTPRTGRRRVGRPTAEFGVAKGHESNFALKLGLENGTENPSRRISERSKLFLLDTSSVSACPLNPQQSFCSTCSERCAQVRLAAPGTSAYRSYHYAPRQSSGRYTTDDALPALH
eukprot:scaffold70669_cov44-Prasinocladus_malaysianus.AAC.1